MTRVVVLGDGSVTVDPAVPRESQYGIEELLASRPDAAIIAAEGFPAFFRASVALERGVPRIVVRPGSLLPEWLEELSVRAAELGGEVFVREEHGYRRVRGRQRVEVGAPPETSFGAIADPGSRSDPLPLVETPPLECEQVAFAIGLKPVLYLVVRRGELAEVRARYGDAEIVTRDDRLQANRSSGERTYGIGDEVAHVFIARDGGNAARAAELWAEGSSHNVEELGEAMGYPRCCVRAFAAMASRRTNAAFPYVTAARTRALGARFDPRLDVTVLRLIPFVPCTYGCPHATEWAQRVADGAGVTVRPRVVLWFDEARAIAFDDAAIEGSTVRFRGPRWAAPANDALQRAYGSVFGDRGTFAVGPNGTADRPDGLGVVLPFALSATLSDR